MDIKTIRKRMGLTLEEVSALSNVSAMYISELERGIKKNPSYKKLNDIAKALQVSIDELLQEDNKDS